MGQTDAIVVLGGGVRDRGVLPPWVRARFDLALEQRDFQGSYICLSQATTHRPPPVDHHGFPIFECTAGARYLAGKGVATDRIRLEGLSLDTIGNAYFCRILHTDPANWRKLLVITSEFHMPRTRMIFEWIFRLDSSGYELEFRTAPNLGMTAAGIAVREQREQGSIAAIKNLSVQIGSMAELYRWIFTEHEAYSVAGRLADRAPLDPETVESY